MLSEGGTALGSVRCLKVDSFGIFSEMSGLLSETI